MEISKAEARKKYRDVRKMLTPYLVSMASEEISNQLAKLDFNNKLVHVFLPIKRLNEVNLQRFINHCYAENISLCTSVSDFSSSRMTSVELNSTSDLKENQWGIPEPINGKEIPNDNIDVVIVPLIYADKMGNRVGYGKGFYDRFLASCKTDLLKIGVNYFKPKELISDPDITDIKLDKLIYPTE